MAKLTLEQAETIVDAALAKGAELKLKPLTVAILDDGAHLKLLKRQDGPGAAMRPKIAIGKGFAAAGLGMGTRPWEGVAKERPLLLQGFMALADEFVAVPGGVVIRDRDGAFSVGSASPATHRMPMNNARLRVLKPRALPPIPVGDCLCQ